MSAVSDPVACSDCGAGLPSPAFKFCPECGTPVAVAPPREVRKTVTLLFTDVTGSTALGEALDPEALRSMMGRYFAVSKASVERHGGTVEKFVGDAVLAVFGVPDVREDDALRAVRAAHELNTAVRALSEELTTSLGVVLQIRTGVNTGSVVAGEARAGGSFATGDAVNTAARLEQAAGPGEVLLGGATYDLVRDAVSVEAVDPISARGKTEPVKAYRLVAVDDTAAGRQRRPDAALIGRDRETRALDDSLERTLDTGRGHLVTVTGAPGIGKSRLVAEFLGRVGERATVLTGRCVSYGQGITYWPIVQVLRDAAGLDGTESAEVAGHALLQVLPGAGDDAAAVDLLLPLLGQGGEPGSADQTRWAVSRVLEQLALRRPLVVSLDDLHWAEPTLLDLLDRVCEETRDLPLLMVCQARPELLETRPGWGQSSLNATVFGLEPFDASLTSSSLAAILGPGVPAEVADAVAGWSGGNPLFVEEIAGHLVESGMLVRANGGWVRTDDLDTARVPATVSALIAARLDRLPDAERRALVCVSVVGLETTADQAALLVGEEPSRLLSALARRDLLRRVRSSTGDVWAFRHGLIREAAYEALPKVERAQLHVRLADHLEGRDDAGGENGAFVAHHLGRAAAYAVLLVPSVAATRDVVDRAGRAFGDAADSARQREDYAAAVALLLEAIGLPTRGRLRRTLLVQLVQARTERYEVDSAGDAVTLLEEALDDLDDPADELERAHAQLERAAWLSHSPGPTTGTPIVDAAHRVAALAEAGGDRRRQAIAIYYAYTSATDQLHCARFEDESAEIERIGDVQDRRIADLWRGAVLIYGPRPLTDMVDYARHLLETSRSGRVLAYAAICHQMGLAARGEVHAVEVLPVVADGLAAYPDDTEMWMFASLANLVAGRNGDASRGFGECVQLFRAAGDTAHGSTYLLWQALAAIDDGADPASVAALVDEGDAWTSPRDPFSVALLHAARTQLCLHRGEFDAALEHVRRAFAALAGTDSLWLIAEVGRWCSRVYRQLGDPAAERELLTQARDLYAVKCVTTWDDEIAARLSELACEPSEM